MNLFKGWNLVVPLEKRCRTPCAFNRTRIEFPDRINHRMVMRIQNVLFKLGVPRDMDLRHALCRNTIYVIMGIEIVVSGRHINIVDVQEDAAIRQFHHFGKKLPLRHLRNVEFGITAYVLHSNRYLKKVPHFTNFLCGEAGSLEGIGHGQQVVTVGPIDAAPAQMVSQPRCLCAPDQRLQSPPMLAIWWLMGTKVHRNTMLDDLIALKNLIKNMQRSSTIDHVVLGDDLEPIHNRLFRENVLVMRHTKTYPNSKVCESVESICWHKVTFLKGKEGRDIQPRPTGVEVLSSGPAWVDRLAFLIHRLRSRPCLCRNSCLCSRCHWPYSHPCPCKSSAPYMRAFQSCLCPSCPCRHHHSCSPL